VILFVTRFSKIIFNGRLSCVQQRTNSAAVRRRGAPAFLRQSSLSSEGNDSNLGFPFPASFAGGDTSSMQGPPVERKGSFLGRTTSAGSVAQNNVKALSNNRFVFQGLGVDENSQSNAGGTSVWSEHVKRSTMGTDTSAPSGQPAAMRAPQGGTKRDYEQGSTGISLRTALWAGLAANRFKRSKTK
jgi:hypothetical protein